MSIDKEFVLDALLRHNYFPTQRKSSEELPPVFNSCRFTKEVAEEINSLPSRPGGYDQVEYRLTRFNNVYRLLTIPHPLPHAKLCLTIHNNWENIDYITDNPNSHIKPKRHADGRLVVMDYEPTISKSLHQITESFGKRFKVHTDITNCFPSIYSHAIPWALVGFDVEVPSVVRLPRGGRHATSFCC